MEKKAALDPALVQDFVANAHGNKELVLEMLAQEPLLINAAWDWGGGDWETGLGAASHMGRRDIAYSLLERGARIDIFVLAMLGQIESVRAILGAFPSALHTPGPHGISLLNHAKAGGEEATAVVTFLQQLIDREQ